MSFGIKELIMILFSLLPVLLLYSIIKFAVKSAIKELKKEGKL